MFREAQNLRIVSYIQKVYCARIVRAQLRSFIPDMLNLALVRDLFSFRFSMLYIIT